MAKNSIEKEKENNPTTPGAGLSKSEAAIKKTKEITDKLNDITGKVSIGLTYITLGQDGLKMIKTLSNASEEELVSSGEIEGTLVTNIDKLNNFLDSNLEGNNNGSSPDVYDNYILDKSNKQHRIYRPKKN